MAPFSSFLTFGPAPARQILGVWGQSPQIISSRFRARKGCNRAPSRHNIAGVLSYSVSRKLRFCLRDVRSNEGNTVIRRSDYSRTQCSRMLTLNHPCENRTDSQRKRNTEPIWETHRVKSIPTDIFRDFVG